MRRIGITDKPVIATIDPHIHLVPEDDLDGAIRRVGGKDVRFHDGHIRLDEDPAIESGNRGAQSQWIDQHRHAARRAATGNRKSDACVLQGPHGTLRARRQYFLLSDERAVDIGEYKRDFRCGANGCYHVRAPRFRHLPLRAIAVENEALDRASETILAIAFSYEIRCLLHLRTGITHGDAETTSRKHRNVIAAVADGGDFPQWNIQ